MSKGKNFVEVRDDLVTKSLKSLSLTELVAERVFNDKKSKALDLAEKAYNLNQLLDSKQTELNKIQPNRSWIGDPKDPANMTQKTEFSFEDGKRIQKGDIAIKKYREEISQKFFEFESNLEKDPDNTINEFDKYLKNAEKEINKI